ncbi:MAG: hypothetical protein ABIU10_08955 [Sphingomicrobium sp.]
MCGLVDQSTPAKSVRWKRYCAKIGLLDAAGNVLLLALCEIGWRKALVTAKGHYGVRVQATRDCG